MTICGLKLTHDGAIAVIENGKVVFSVELEKIKNNLRYSSIDDTKLIKTILIEYGYELSDIDHFVVDGWGGFNNDALAIQPRLEIGEKSNWLTSENEGKKFKMPIAQYTERTLEDDVLTKNSFEGLQIGSQEFKYSSFLHVTGHIMSAYCTSPFAERKEDSYILVWDGGMFPRLYYFDTINNKIENLGPLFFLIGNAYSIFSQHFGPFKVNGSFAKDSLSVAGKVMAYVALGKVDQELFKFWDAIYNSAFDKPMGFANTLANQFKSEVSQMELKDEDILRSFHEWLEITLVQKLKKKIERLNRPCKNLCYSGGCALNIKWNSAIRESNVFKHVYIPPFPNDSGSAIGTAASLHYHLTKNAHVQWNVYSGPAIKDFNDVCPGWRKSPMDIKSLARLIHEKNEPVVFLNGRAELGPRALGNRSILAASVSPVMKDILNNIKKRESYRPVSPICLENRAAEIFKPGQPDPFMLFDHLVKPEWINRIPAVCHIDTTARLQTVSHGENGVIANLLTEYEKLSGIPLLCNTSANFNGSGFFPDIASAMTWGKVNYIWSEGVLFEMEEKIVFNFEDVAAEL